MNPHGGRGAQTHWLAAGSRRGVVRQGSRHSLGRVIACAGVAALCACGSRLESDVDGSWDGVAGHPGLEAGPWSHAGTRWGPADGAPPWRNRRDASTSVEPTEDGSVDSRDGDSWSDVSEVEDAGLDVESVITDASVSDVSAEAAPSPTTEVTIVANLCPGPYSKSGNGCTMCPVASSNSNLCDMMGTFSVFDSNGHSQFLSIGFCQMAPNTWDYVLEGDTDVGALYAGPCVDFGSGTLTFADSGALQSVTSTGGTITFPGSSSPQTITVDFGTPIDENGSGLDGVTQFESMTEVFMQSANGSP